MKEYIINKTPVKTTNNFKVNNLKIKLDIPEIKNFNDISIINTDNVDIKTNKNGGKIKTELGINFDKSYKIDITIPKYITASKPIVITYNFNNDEILVSDINIIYEENSKADIVFIYKSKNKSYNVFKENIKAYKNSKGSISILNMLDDNSCNILSIRGKIRESAEISHNFFDIGADIKLSNINIDLEEYKSKHYLNNIYIGNNKNIIDMNYYVKNIGKNSLGDIVVEGVLDDEAKKTFKGTIDFKKNSSLSTGKENENCIILSNKVINRSLPMLLCHEENVTGSHGVSSGKINEEKLFYLMSRSFSKKEAERIIINANFNKIIDKLPIDELKEEINAIINKKI